MDDYKDGYCMYMIDRCKNYCEGFVEAPLRGHTRLEIRMSEPLPEAVTVIIYAQFQGKLEISESRNVNICY